jgi:hypothetical protein
MDISLDTYVNFIFIWWLLATPITIYYAKRKLAKPLLVIGGSFFLSLVPPISIVVILILWYKRDLNKELPSTSN